MKYPKGAFFNLPHHKAPDFVKGQINISNKKEFIDWLNSQDGNQVKLSLKVNRDGKGYAEIDTYEAKKDADGYPKNSQQNNPSYDDSNDLPF